MRNGRAELAAHHGRNQRGLRQFRRDVFADQAAVAQHRDAIRNGVDLIEEMGYEQDGHAAAAQPLHHGKQFTHLILVETGSGLIQYQHPCRHTQRACNGHHLLHGHRIAVQWPLHVELQMQLREQRHRAFPHLRVVDQSAPVPRVASDEKILRHRQVGTEVHFLIDSGNAGALRLEWSARGNRDAADPDRAGVRRLDAGKQLDERGFAGAILAHQCVDFARAQSDAGALEGHGGTEALA